MISAARSLKQLILSPTAFFEERSPPETLPMAAGIVALFAITFVVGFLLLGSMLAGAIDASITMDNPDRPSEKFCDVHADAIDSTLDDECDEPETIERDAGAVVQEVVNDRLWIAVIGPFVMWVVAGVVLYGVGGIVGHDPSFSGTLALAGWAALPEFFRLAVGLLALRIGLANVTITDPEQAVTVFEEAMAPIEPFLLIASLVTVGWQWYLITGGLSQEADIPWKTAAVGVAVPLGIVALLSLV